MLVSHTTLSYKLKKKHTQEKPHLKNSTHGPFHGVNQNTANRQTSCLLQWQQPIISSSFHRRYFELQKRGHF